MSKVRMFSEDGAGHGENPSPRTTIVGGRPPEDQRDLPPVPTGVQSLLRLAQADATFRSALIARRHEVAEAAGVSLTPSERAVLAAAPSEQLEAMAMSVPEPAPERREFLRQAALAAMTVLGTGALGTACASRSAGKGPGSGVMDPDPPRVDDRESQTVGGAAPDVPPPRPDAGSAPVPPAGVRPDVPAPRPRDLDVPLAGAVADPPPTRPSRRDTETDGGANPHWDGDDGDMRSKGGAAPDMPPPRRPGPDAGTGPIRGTTRR
jgi:hypothetical protein